MTREISKFNVPETRGTWVQTERAAHELWANLGRDNPRASTLLHKLIANMDERGALVASQSTLATLCGCSLATIKRAVADLAEGNWIQTVNIGTGRGSTLAYVVNSRVAWADKRENLKYAAFSARVLINERDNPDLGIEPLKKTPILGLGEYQLPHGPGLPPPSQSEIDETLPDLPSIKADQPASDNDQLRLI
ncbi:helix-turn-helix domain-containing protein [Pseudomonas viridiflava]|uniref:helix-turn-helix domain-containing protein n=1 Tax=Pseudomonas viridiflava TaxID=33069 RepID=UPI000F02AA34|nr:helix-turn-helix domain-containing protein [Pseudomonas viridiflava]